MTSRMNYRQRRQKIFDDTGYSDDGLYSDDEFKPPAEYLHKRRNAFCVTSLSSNQEPPQGTTTVLNFLKKRGIAPHVQKRKSEESELVISSDDDDLYFRKVSDELKKRDVSLQVTLPYPLKSKRLEQSPNVDRRLMMRGDKVQMPGFLKTQHKVVTRSTPVQGPPVSVKDMATAIGKMSLLPSGPSVKMPNVSTRGVDKI